MCNLVMKSISFCSCALIGSTYVLCVCCLLFVFRQRRYSAMSQMSKWFDVRSQCVVMYTASFMI